MELKTSQIKIEPFERFAKFIIDRENVRIRRKTHEVGPWTKNKILQGYHFTNVRREDDKVSQYLFNVWYPGIKRDSNVHLDSNAHLWGAIMIARFINSPESLDVIMEDIKARNYTTAKDKLAVMMSEGKTVFRSAYLQPEIKGFTRLEKIFEVLLPKIIKADIPISSLKAAVEKICSIKYFGEFMAGQIVMDAMYLIDSADEPNSWADCFTYAPIGPGSVRGLNRLREKELTRKLKRPQYETEIAELHLCREMWKWRALDLEHALCEWDKYERLLWGQGSYNRKR